MFVAPVKKVGTKTKANVGLGKEGEEEEGEEGSLAVVSEADLVQFD